MKKVILFVASFFAANLFAATDAQIINHFKNTIQVPNISVEVVERHSVEGVAGMDFVTLNLSDGTRAQKLSIFTKDDLIFPDVISIKQGGSIKEMMEMAELQKKMSVLYKKEDKKAKIKFNFYNYKDVKIFEDKLRNKNISVYNLG